MNDIPKKITQEEIEKLFEKYIFEEYKKEEETNQEDIPKDILAHFPDPKPPKQSPCCPHCGQPAGWGTVSQNTNERKCSACGYVGGYHEWK